MGSKQFQGEYIEYLQARNNELFNKLSLMKESYENKIFSKDINKHCLVSILEDVLNVCSTLPQEIDLFFDKMTAAMSVLKNVLLKKSQMVQLANKISESLNMAKDSNIPKIMDMCDVYNEENSNTKSIKKCSTAKISPMINGHVISTEPRIYLSRVSEDSTPREREGTQKLSPIIEASPEISLLNASDVENLFSKEIRIPLERINCNKLPYKVLSEASPKSRFQGPKTWKKSLSTKKGQIGAARNPSSVEDQENLKEKNDAIVNNETSQPKQNPKDVDPLEGPSWLYDEGCNSSRRGSSQFFEFRKRKRRFASVFDKNEDLEDESSGKGKEEKSSGEVQNLSSTSESGTNRTNDGLRASDNKQNETSSDFIFESFKEYEEKNSTLKEAHHSSDRTGIEDSDDLNDENVENEFNEFETDTDKKMSTPYNKNKITDNPSTKTSSLPLSDTDSSDEEEEVIIKYFSQKPPLKSPQENEFNKCDERTPQFLKKKRGRKPKKISKSSEKSGKTQNRKEKSAKRKQSVKFSLERKKSSEINSTRVESCSPPDVPSESGGRRKRRAAPSNLSEPNLHSKLRRD